MSTKTMTSRQRVLNILDGKPADRVAFWTGNPHSETLSLYLGALGLKDREALYSHLGDDCRWFPADAGWKHPEGRPMFNPIPGLCVQARTPVANVVAMVDAVREFNGSRLK